MNQINLTQNIQSNITVIPNQFIDQYMLKADGEFVKIYLLLLRLMNQGKYTGPDQIADMLNLMEKDVIRALQYWTKEGLIAAPADVTPAPIVNTVVENSIPQIKQAPDKTGITPSDLKSAMAESDLAQTCYMAEAYIGHPLSHSDITTFYYIENQLNFSQDLLEYLIEYCVTRGKKSVRYMETVAIAWYQQNIDSVKKAKEQSISYTQNVFSVMKAFGISNRNPAPSELDYIKKWNGMDFDVDIIVEACNRTMLATHQASFPYASRILEDWKKQGVRTMADIQNLDQNFHAKKPAVSVTTSAGGKKSNNNAFHNFEQRSYDYDDLESRLRDIKHSN